MQQGEIVIFQANEDTSFQIEVKVEKDTVWLNRLQIAELFDRDINLNNSCAFSLLELRRRTLKLYVYTARGLQLPVPNLVREKVRQRKNEPLVNLSFFNIFTILG